MSKLFLSTPEFEKIASNFHMDEDPNKWVKQITTYIVDNHPYIDVNDVDIKVKQSDYENGTAIIGIYVNPKDKQREVIIPVIIKNFEMFPLDTFQVDDEILPLDEKTYAEKTHKTALFSGRKSQQQGLNFVSLYDEMAPPRTGKTVYASDKNITIDKLDMDSFNEFIDANKNVAASFLHNKTASIVKKFQEKDTEFTKKAIHYIEDLFSEDFCQIRPVGMRKYAYVTSPAYMYLPRERVISREEAVAKIASLRDGIDADKASKILDELDVNKGDISFIKSADYDDRGRTIPGGTGKIEMNPITKPGRYRVRTTEGVNLEGYAVPDVVDFNLKKVKSKLFFTGTDHNSLQDEIVGVEGYHDGSNQELVEDDIVTGATGSFVFESNGHMVATVPVKILKTFKIDNSIGAWAETVMGDKVPFFVNPNVKTIVKFSPGKASALSILGEKVYLIPDSMRFKHLNGQFVKLLDKNPSESEAKEKEKTAHEKHELDIFYEYGRYSFKGQPIEKLAHMKDIKINNESEFMKNSPEDKDYYEKDNVKYAQAKFLMMNMNLDESFIEDILKVAKRVGHIKISSVDPIKSCEEIESRMSKLSELIDGSVSGIKKNLTKEASVIEDQETVDSILSLNFVNNKNIYEFVKEIPNFESTLKKLAELLMMVRMGLKDVPEEAVKKCMIELSDVITRLKNLSFVLNNVAKGNK